MKEVKERTEEECVETRIIKIMQLKTRKGDGDVLQRMCLTDRLTDLKLEDKIKTWKTKLYSQSYN